MQYLSNIASSRNWRSDPGEVLQKLNMIKERCSKRFRSGFIVNANVVEDAFQIC